MVATILVPYDGSEFAGQALTLAVDVALRADASLLLLQVDGAIPAAEPGEAPEALVEADRRRQERQRAHLDATAEELRDAGVAVTARLERGGISDTLVRVAEEEADLVVMATHGRGPFSRFWLGSVADALTRRCTVPLLLMKPREEDDGPVASEAFERIVVGLDGSELAETVLPIATELGALFGARYSLLRVVRPIFPGVIGYEDVPQAVDPGMIEEIEQAAAEYVEGVADRLREEGHEVEGRVVRGSSVPWAILEAAGEEGASAVALAAHGRGGLGRALLGSTADKVVRGARGPVLLHRPAVQG